MSPTCRSRTCSTAACTGARACAQALKATIEATLVETEQAALDAGIARVRAVLTGNPPPELSPEHERTLAGLRDRFGLDRVNCALTAAAPCPRAVHEFMHGLGLPFGEFWGMSEIGVVTMTGSGPCDIGTVGRPLPVMATDIHRN